MALRSIVVELMASCSTPCLVRFIFGKSNHNTHGTQFEYLTTAKYRSHHYWFLEVKKNSFETNDQTVNRQPKHVEVIKIQGKHVAICLKFDKMKFSANFIEFLGASCSQKMRFFSHDMANIHQNRFPEHKQSRYPKRANEKLCCIWKELHRISLFANLVLGLAELSWDAAYFLSSFGKASQ